MGGISPTVTCCNLLYRFERNDGAEDNYMELNGIKYRVRRLTENECAKLMGLPKIDNKLNDIGIAKTQRYKCYGNGIVTDCVKLIFEHLYKALYDKKYKCTDERVNENFPQAAMI